MEGAVMARIDLMARCIHDGAGRDRTRTPRFLCWSRFALVALGWLALGPSSAAAAGVAPDPVAPRAFLVELYVAGAEQWRAELALWGAAADRCGGIRLNVLDCSQNDVARQRRETIVSRHRLDPAAPLVLYGCERALPAASRPEAVVEQLDRLRTMTVFHRPGCPHCADAIAFLQSLQQQFPGLKLVYRDLVHDPHAAADLQRLTEVYQSRGTSVPVLHYFDRLHVGFDSPATTGLQLEGELRKWSVPMPPRHVGRSRLVPAETVWRTAGAAPASATFPVGEASVPSAPTGEPSAPQRPASTREATAPLDSMLPLEAMSPLDPVLPLPEESLPLEPDATLERDGGTATGREEIHLPLFGRVSPAALGLPLFTIAVGLVDGFNPCAMWVLLFLLSILVNLRDRWKILAVAGTFVVISGVAYYAFMAAWLNVFAWIGLLRPAQVALGLLALTVGTIHIKDFFAFRQGVSLSIPESAKPGIYARVRRIVSAENLTGAIAGAAVLAVLVNVIELLCTAGLPAMYTGILTLRQLPPWQDYAYLGLYILAYMFDDALMTALVIVTLDRYKLQERGGRWLKLVSGAVIALLGAVMLLRPEWLA